jgi:glycerol uptake facilitator-like aquaporin
MHNWSILQVIISESIGVFILIFFILYGTGSYSFIQNNGAKYVYIAIFVYIGRKFAASSANQINLALTFSQAFVGLFECDFRGFKFLIAWIIGDMIGVLLAATLYIKLV